MIHLITGGSGSGKSAYAEDWLQRDRLARRREAGLIYVAAMIPYGREAAERIRRHQKMRSAKGFATIECYRDLESLEVPENGGVLLECMSNLTANEFYQEDGTQRPIDKTFEKIWRGVRHLESQTDCLVIVTNEVHADVDGYSEETEQYRRLLGKLNIKLAGIAGKVTEVVYGIAVEMKTDEEMVE